MVQSRGMVLPSVGAGKFVAAGLPLPGCCMLIIAVVWSGVRGLICGARDEDARAIGFDEGAKPADWVKALEHRGIAVISEVQRQSASAVLQQYQQEEGCIYNAAAGAGQPGPRD